eukprot:scaffold123726_cov14-Tisochrysis_lutea.AAC.1
MQQRQAAPAVTVVTPLFSAFLVDFKRQGEARKECVFRHAELVTSGRTNPDLGLANPPNMLFGFPTFNVYTYQTQ